MAARCKVVPAARPEGSQSRAAWCVLFGCAFQFGTRTRTQPHTHAHTRARAAPRVHTHTHTHTLTLSPPPPRSLSLDGFLPPTPSRLRGRQGRPTAAHSSWSPAGRGDEGEGGICTHTHTHTHTHSASGHQWTDTPKI